VLGKARAWTIVGTTFAIWLALVVVGVATNNTKALPTISQTLPIILGAIWIYEAWGWRYVPLPRPLGVPNLNGTWQGTLTSLWKDGSGTSPEPIPAYLAIQQTLTSISVRLFTKESQSLQIAGAISKMEAGDPAISYVYRNTPRVDLRIEVSPMHHGAAILTIYDGQVTRIAGDYWNERQGKGSISFDMHASARARSFEEASSMEYQPKAT
jgi:hypothetical protein